MTTYYLVFTLIAVCDLKNQLIPKGLNFFLIFWSILLQLNQIGFMAIAFSIFSFLTYAALFRVTGGRIGYGDVRLAPAVANLKTSNPVAIHLIAWVLAGVYAIFTGKRKKNLPLAPFLLIASLMINHL